MGFTDNGARCFTSTGNPNVDLFVSCCREADEDTLRNNFTKSWNKDPYITLKIIFNTRDCRGGKGEKDVAMKLISLLKWYKPETYRGNMGLFYKTYGCFKDIFKVMTNQEDGDISNEYKYIVDQLQEDLHALNSQGNISLLAKWVPLERGEYGVYGRSIARLMFPGDETYLARYRKEVVVPLRKNLNIVETKMCNGEWSNIRFDRVPSRAMNLYKDAFMRHAQAEYEAYLTDLKEGKTKINTAGISPHELVGHYMNDNDFNETVEYQWNALLTKMRGKGTLNNTIAVVDVSGSMRGRPMTVAIALGILTSSLCSGQFSRYVIPFSDKAELYKLENYTLCNMVKEMQEMVWAMNTNIVDVFKLILNTAKMYRVPESEMIKNIVVLTDMQFDESTKDGNDMTTTYEVIKELYDKSGYAVPRLIFWNLKGGSNVAYPVESTTPNTAIVSGYSEYLLKCFMEDCDFTPEGILTRVLEKYDNVFIHRDELGEI